MPETANMKTYVSSHNKGKKTGHKTGHKKKSKKSKAIKTPLSKSY